MRFDIAEADEPTDQDVKQSDHSSANRSDAVTLNKVDVTATAAPKVDPAATYTESVIGSDVVRNLSPGPSTTVQTMLNQEPSIFAYTNGPLGVSTSIYFRAFNTSQFSETYAGVALNDIFNGGVTGQAENRNNVLITPNNLDSVQLYRGINNPAVNSYNSLGGTINFLPRQPTEAFGGEVGVSYGSYATYDAHATVNVGDWNGLKQIVSIEQSGSDGWIQNTSDRNQNLYYGANYAINDRNLVYNYLLYNHNTGYAPFDMPLPLLQQFGDSYQWPKNWTNSHMKDTNWLDIVGWKAEFSSTVVFENKFYFGTNEYLRTSFSNPLFQQSATQPYFLEDTPSSYAFWLGYPNGPTYDPQQVFGSVEDGTKYHFYGYTASGVGDSPTVTLSLPSNEIVAGGNIAYGNLHSREYWYGSAPVPQIDGYNDTWDEHDHRTLASVFIQDTISLLGDQLRVTPGLKYIYAKTSDHDAVGIYYPISGTVSDNEHFLSPTLGANYAIADGWHVYAAYGKNFKLPDISAYYSAFQTDASGNNTIVPPRVKPEYVNDYEVGVRFEHDGLNAALNAYREDFTNTFISVTDPSTQLIHFLNGGSSKYQGVELQMKQDFGDFEGGHFSGYLNLAHNQATFTSTFVSDVVGQVNKGQPLADVPKNLASAGLLWQRDGWRVDVTGRFVDRQFIDQLFAGTPTASTIKAYTVFDVGISRIIELAAASHAKFLKLGLNIDNIFDRRYLNTAFTDTDYSGNSFVRGIFGAPRTVTGSVSLGF